MQKIALIEDDSDLFTLLKYNLEKEGFRFTGAQTGKGAVELCRQERPDLVVLDIMLPDANGLEICRNLRADPDLAHIPVIFLTACSSETDRIVGLELGASDYIVKPFFVREFVARVKIQFRRHEKPSRWLQAGPLSLYPATCRVILRGADVSLTATEFRLLEFLMASPGVVFSREQLLDAVWGHSRSISDRAVDVYILRLRQKIEPDPADPIFIRSIRGFGYSFNEHASRISVSFA